MVRATRALLLFVAVGILGTSARKRIPAIVTLPGGEIVTPTINYSKRKCGNGQKCDSGGNCTKIPASTKEVCICQLGWAPPTCKKKGCGKCLNDGKCISNSAHGKICKCIQGWTGLSCQEFMCKHPQTKENYCQGNGVCNVTRKKKVPKFKKNLKYHQDLSLHMHRCTCPDDRTGLLCESVIEKKGSKKKSKADKTETTTSPAESVQHTKECDKKKCKGECKKLSKEQRKNSTVKTICDCGKLHGVTGPNCDDPCPPNNYGPGCEGECVDSKTGEKIHHCGSDTPCDPVDGSCADEICDPGYKYLSDGTCTTGNTAVVSTSVDFHGDDVGYATIDDIQQYQRTFTQVTNEGSQSPQSPRSSVQNFQLSHADSGEAVSIYSGSDDDIYATVVPKHLRTQKPDNKRDVDQPVTGSSLLSRRGRQAGSPNLAADFDVVFAAEDAETTDLQELVSTSLTEGADIFTENLGKGFILDTDSVKTKPVVFRREGIDEITEASSTPVVVAVCVGLLLFASVGVVAYKVSKNKKGRKKGSDAESHAAGRKGRKSRAGSKTSHASHSSSKAGKSKSNKSKTSHARTSRSKSSRRSTDV